MLVPLTLLLQIAENSCDVRPSGYYCQSVAADYRVPCLGHMVSLPTDATKRLAVERKQSAALIHQTGTSDAWLTLACTEVTLSLMSVQRAHAFALMFARPIWYERAIIAALPAARLATDSATDAVPLLASLLIWSHPGRPDPQHVDVPWVANLPNFRPARDALTRYVQAGLPIVANRAAARPADGGLQRACTSLALDAVAYADAHRCAFQGAIDQYKVTWNMLRLAWLAFHRADTTAGVIAFRKGVDAAQDSVARLDLGWQFAAGTDMSLEWGTPDDEIIASPALMKQRMDWLAIPLDRLVRWVASDSSPPAGWVPLATPDQLASHFTQVAFAGEEFRACMAGEREPPCGGKPVDALHARRLRLWATADSAIIVMPYQMTIDAKSPAKNVTELQLKLRQWNLSGAIRDDSVMTHRDGKMLEGVLVEPSQPALDSWTLDFVAPGIPPGTFQDFQSPLDSGTLTLSDIAIGAPDSRLRWQHDALDIPVTATDTFDLRQPVALYVQGRCATQCGVITRSIRLYRLPARSAATPSIAISTTMPSHAGVMPVTTELDVSRLPKGAYRLEVELHSDAVAATARRSTQLILH